MASIRLPGFGAIPQLQGFLVLLTFGGEATLRSPTLWVWNAMTCLPDRLVTGAAASES